MRRMTLGALLIGMLVSTAAQAAPTEETRPVAGLGQPAEIRVDRWGIPHIYAASIRDAFFLQGYNAARDRLWQIDLWRKRGLGLLARDFGPAYAAQDRAARLFLYRGDMTREWAAYGQGAEANTQAFVAGVNAYVEEIRAGNRPLPMEFKLAGNTPDLWTAEDVVRIRSHGLTRNASMEVARARIACAAGLPATRLFRKLEPAWTTRVPEGLDPCDIPADVLADYDLATSGVKFSKAQAGLASLDSPPDSQGSNNWTIAPSHTTTGRPILANDPHRDHGAPSLRYIVHLEAPGLSVIGAGEPALPGVSIGHNDTIAFGLTIFYADQEDLYVYETDPKDPDLYRYGTGWERMSVVKDRLEVKGGPPVEATLRFTRHGPVVYTDPQKNRAYAVRSVWGEPGTSAYFGSTGYMTAKTWPEFKAALAGWGAPSENQVYADTSGHIGWVAAGRVPVRPNWDGLLPAPGDGRYEWKGALKPDDLPSTYDPKRGWFASANAMNLPADYPVAERKVGFEWSNNARLTRIEEVLAAKPKVSLADAMALQTDPTDVTSRRLIALLAPLRSDDPTTAAALDLLRRWDGSTTPDSAAAAVFETWTLKHLGRATVARAAPAAARGLIGSGDIAAVMDYLEHPDAALGAEPGAARDQILLASLGDAAREVAARLGPDPKTWAWGRLHQAEFVHALSPLATPEQAAAMKAGPAPMGGTSLSPMAATWRAGDFRVVSGASFRMVLDVGNWDASRTINTPGQSGDPASPHFRDLFPLWVKGEYVPLVYSRKAVEDATETVIRLTPGP
ncbi:MAG TPA: penicillin acylase family protein [Phenylobacterium sp.]|nr:penicillin acylase family protein [Phenylobacterium sp.]